MPDSIWHGLVGAGVMGITVVLYYRAAIAQKNRELVRKDAEIERVKKRNRRDKKRVIGVKASILGEKEQVIAQLSRAGEKIEKALDGKGAQLVELSREIETHDKWLRLARVSRQMPALVWRATLNTVAHQETTISEVYRLLREQLGLPHVDRSALERVAELSLKEQRSLAIHLALHASHEAISVDMVRIGLLASSPMLIRDELTDYMITDEEVEAYILDWVRTEVGESFFELVTQEPRDASVVGALRPSSW